MQVAEDLRIYSSLIIKTYIEYLKLQYPQVAPDALLDFSGMSREQVEDPAHWFTQSQINRFHEALAEKTRNPNVSREAGRYAASSKASGVFKQYAMGFISPLSAYRLLEMITSHLTKGGVFRTTKLGSKTVMNLVLSAVEAIPGEGRVVLSAETLQIKEAIRGYEMIEPGEYAVLSVTDTGVGISARNLEKIFEPFYTKKAMGRSGSGLGMAIVWGTVKDHRGYVDVKSEEGKGTTFDLYFPVPSEAQAKT